MACVWGFFRSWLEDSDQKSLATLQRLCFPLRACMRLRGMRSEYRPLLIVSNFVQSRVGYLPLFTLTVGSFYVIYFSVPGMQAPQEYQYDWCW